MRSIWKGFRFALAGRSRCVYMQKEWRKNKAGDQFRGRKYPPQTGWRDVPFAQSLKQDDLFVCGALGEMPINAKRLLSRNGNDRGAF